MSWLLGEQYNKHKKTDEEKNNNNNKKTITKAHDELGTNRDTHAALAMIGTMTRYLRRQRKLNGNVLS